MQIVKVVSQNAIVVQYANVKLNDNEYVYIINVHSFVDLITNSSTEIFVVDSEKIEESVKEIFKFLVDSTNLGIDSYIVKFTTNPEDFSDIVLPKEYENNKNSLYYFSIDQNNTFLINIIEKYFNPLKD